MRIPPAALEEFKRIYKEEYGKDLSDAEAYENASKMLRLMELVYKPMTKKDYEEITERQKVIRSQKTAREQASEGR